MFEPMSLAGRRVLITGASSGIGRACALYAARLGAQVVLTARRPEELERTREMMVGREGHTCFAGDLTASGFVDELVVRTGRCDGLIYAAGTGFMAPAGMVDPSKFEAVMRLNCGAFVELMNRLVRRKVMAGTFSAVAVSSVSAFAGWPCGTAYCASKGALSAAVRALAVELAPKGVRVNAVCPSSVDTQLFREQTKLDPAAAEAAVRVSQPLGLGLPEQVAAVACFLLGDASSFVTGANWPVDGGFLAR